MTLCARFDLGICICIGRHWGFGIRLQLCEAVLDLLLRDGTRRHASALKGI
jgi:hypothetical protein